MENNYSSNHTVWIVIILISAIVLFFLIIAFASWLNEFQKELRFINNEIRRTRGAEKRYWMRKKRRLWLSIIPFIKY